MGYLIFDYIISFIVLLVIHAPWWAWLIYVVSALVWLGIGALCDGGASEKTTDISKQGQSCTED
jgi:hypothetical protein